jgi:hypothetical protein
LLCGCIIVRLFLLLRYVFSVSLSILIVMYVPFCVIVLFSVLFVCECVLGQLPPGYRGTFRLP